MKNKILYILSIIILILIILLLSFKLINCVKNSNSCISDTIVVYKTQTIDKFVEVPVKIPIYYEKLKYDTLWQNKDIDTNEIIKEYFENCLATIYYSDTIQDSTIYAVINDTIQMSEIKYRQFLYGIKKYKEVTKTVYIKDNGFYAGLNIGRSKNEFGFGGSILYKKDNNIFGISYDVMNNDLYLNYQRKITFRK